MSFISKLAEAVRRTSNRTLLPIRSPWLFCPFHVSSLGLASLPARLKVFQCQRLRWSNRSQICPPIFNTWKTGQNMCSQGLDKGLPGIMVHERKETRWTQDCTSTPSRAGRGREPGWAEESSKFGQVKETRVCGPDTGQKGAAQVKLNRAPLPHHEKFFPCPPFLDSS